MDWRSRPRRMTLGVDFLDRCVGRGPQNRLAALLRCGLRLIGLTGHHNLAVARLQPEPQHARTVLVDLELASHHASGFAVDLADDRAQCPLRAVPAQAEVAGPGVARAAGAGRGAACRASACAGAHGAARRRVRPKPRRVRGQIAHSDHDCPRRDHHPHRPDHDHVLDIEIVPHGRIGGVRPVRRVRIVAADRVTLRSIRPAHRPRCVVIRPAQARHPPLKTGRTGSTRGPSRRWIASAPALHRSDR